jgi:hypothetical protein
MPKHSNLSFTKFKAKNLLDEFDDVAQRILASGLTDYPSIVEKLGLKDYIIPRLFKIIESMPQTIYRARPATDFDYWDKSEYHHPPAEYCKLMGWANFIGDPVFYGAISAETAVKELMIQDRRIKNDDQVFISEWRINIPGRFYIAFLLYPEGMFNGSLYEQFEQMSKDQYDELVKNEVDFDGESYKKLYQKIGGYFINAGTENYPLTAFIAGNLFHGAADPKMNTPIIAYPTVSGMYNGVNYAIEKNFAEKYLELTEIRFGSFGGFKEEGFTMNSARLCEVQGNNIQWFDFITRIYHDKFGIEYDFEGDYPDDLDPKDTVLMKDGAEFDIRTFVKELVNNDDGKLLGHIPSSFKYDEIPFEQQTKAVGLNFPPRSIYVVHKGQALFIDHVNIHLDYKHEKQLIQDKTDFVITI